MPYSFAMVQIAKWILCDQYLKMRAIGCIFLLALVCLSQAAWTYSHEVSGDASVKLAAGVKEQLLANLDKIANKQVADALKNDLNTDDDSKRTLTSIDTTSVNQIFSIFGLKDPGCDTNKDGQVSGDELGCLGKIWKNFVPK